MGLSKSKYDVQKIDKEIVPKLYAKKEDKSQVQMINEVKKNIEAAEHRTGLNWVGATTNIDENNQRDENETLEIIQARGKAAPTNKEIEKKLQELLITTFEKFKEIDEKQSDENEALEIIQASGKAAPTNTEIEKKLQELLIETFEKFKARDEKENQQKQDDVEKNQKLVVLRPAATKDDSSTFQIMNEVKKIIETARRREDENGEEAITNTVEGAKTEENLLTYILEMKQANGKAEPTDKEIEKKRQELLNKIKKYEKLKERVEEMIKVKSNHQKHDDNEDTSPHYKVQLRNLSIHPKFEENAIAGTSYTIEEMQNRTTAYKNKTVVGQEPKPPILKTIESNLLRRTWTYSNDSEAVNEDKDLSNIMIPPPIVRPMSNPNSYEGTNVVKDLEAKRKIYPPIVKITKNKTLLNAETDTTEDNNSKEESKSDEKRSSQDLLWPNQQEFGDEDQVECDSTLKENEESLLDSLNLNLLKRIFIAEDSQVPYNKNFEADEDNGDTKTRTTKSEATKFEIIAKKHKDQTIITTKTVKGTTTEDNQIDDEIEKEKQEMLKEILKYEKHIASPGQSLIQGKTVDTQPPPIIKPSESKTARRTSSDSADSESANENSDLSKVKILPPIVKQVGHQNQQEINVSKNSESTTEIYPPILKTTENKHILNSEQQSRNVSEIPKLEGNATDSISEVPSNTEEEATPGIEKPSIIEKPTVLALGDKEEVLNEDDLSSPGALFNKSQETESNKLSKGQSAGEEKVISKEIHPTLQRVQEIAEQTKVLKEQIIHFSGTYIDAEYKILNEALIKNMLQLHDLPVEKCDEIRTERKRVIKFVQESLKTLGRNVVKMNDDSDSDSN